MGMMTFAECGIATLGSVDMGMDYTRDMLMAMGKEAESGCTMAMVMGMAFMFITFTDTKVEMALAVRMRFLPRVANGSLENPMFDMGFGCDSRC